MFEELAMSIGKAVSNSLFSFVRRYMVGRKKDREIRKLLDDYRIKCAGVNTNVDIRSLLDNEHYCDEMVAHCYRGDLTRWQAIDRFLSGDPSASADSAAHDFVGRLYDEICSIVGAVATADSKALMAGINRGNANDETIIRRLDDMDARLAERGEDDAIAIDYLEQTVRGIELETITFDPGSADKREHDGIIGDYLSAYGAFCQGEKPNVEFCSMLNGSDRLLSSLACVALASENYDAVVTILGFSTEDASAIREAVQHLARKDPDLGRLAETGIDRSSEYVGLVLLMNAEGAYSSRYYYWANEHFASIGPCLNPLSRAHWKISRAWSNAVYASQAIDRERAEEFMASVPRWASPSLVSAFGRVSELLVESLQPDDGLDLVRRADERLKPSLTEAEKRAEIRSGASRDKVKSLMEWAAVERRASVFCEAARRLIGLGEDRESIERAFGLNWDWLAEEFGSLCVYVDLFEGKFQRERFDALRPRYEEDPRFYLLGYKAFLERDDSFAGDCMKAAVPLLGAGPVQPCLEWAECWMPYLHESSGAEGIIGIVAGFLPMLPPSLLDFYFKTAYALPDNEELVSKSMAVLEAAEMRLWPAELVLANYSFSNGNVLKAAKYGLSAFRASGGSERAVDVAFQALLQLAFEVPDDLVERAEQLDTASTNIYLAQLASQEHRAKDRDKHFMRAVSMGGDEGIRAAKIFAMEHVSERGADPSLAVGEDTCVEVLTEDGESVFLCFYGDATAFSSEGAESPAGLHFGTDSTAYVHMRGKSVGDEVDCLNLVGTVVAVESIRKRICRVGFAKMLDDPGVKALSFDPNDIGSFVEQIEQYTGGHRPDHYSSGVDTPQGKLYFGIETGALLSSASQLEFTFMAVTNPRVPYRRVPFGLKRPLEQDCGFLLGYNAVVVLSLLGLPDSTVQQIASRSHITDSTRRRVIQDALSLAEASHKSAGKMGVTDGRMTMLEYDDAHRRRMADLHSSITSLVECLDVIAPALDSTLDLEGMPLSGNQAVDAETAAACGLVLVTEDCLEALILDCLEAPARCSVYALLVTSGCGLHALGHVAAKLSEWGAEPPVDINVAESVRCALAVFPEVAAAGD